MAESFGPRCVCRSVKVFVVRWAVRRRSIDLITLLMARGETGGVSSKSEEDDSVSESESDEGVGGWYCGWDWKSGWRSCEKSVLMQDLGTVRA